MRSRIRRSVATATIAALAMVGHVVQAAPASADVPVVDDAFYGQSVGFDLPGIPLVVAVPNISGGACIVNMTASAGYSKPRFTFVIRESGSVEARPSGDCSGVILDNHVFSGISDHGVGPLASTHSTSDSSGTSGNGVAYTNVYQEVSAYSFPADYHGPGSLIRWTDRVSILVPQAGRLQFCAEFTAIMPGGISGGWGACTG